MLNLEKIKSNVIGFAKANAVWIIVLLIAGFLFGRGCGEDPIPASGVDEKEHIRVIMELAAARDSIHVADSVGKIERAARQRQNEASARERLRLQDQARKSAEKAAYWEGVVKQADEANDHETGKAARDSQIVELKSERDQLKGQLAIVDSIVIRKDIDFALLEASNTAKSDLIDRQQVAMQNMSADLQKLVLENKSLRKDAKRKKFWGGIWNGVKVGGGAVAGFIVGRAVK